MPVQRVERRTVKGSDGRLNSVEFDFTESHGNGSTVRTIKFTRDEYKRSASQALSKTLSFDDASKVLNAFMKGSLATDDHILEAFNALDQNGSGIINVDELALFTPVIAPNFTRETLKSLISKVDRNHDSKLGYSEFANFIKKDIGRQIALNRA